MVLNPRLSQSVVCWCLESALGLIFNAVEKIGDKIDQGKLRQYVDENTANLKVSDKQIKRMFYDLKRHNYIEVGAGDSVILTDKAKIKIIDQISQKREIDGKYRLVSFDIPEIKRTQRNAFRRAIKRMGFKQIQKSLWVTDRNIGKLVDIAAKEYRVGDYVAYFVTERSNIDRFIAKKIKNM